MRAEDGEMSWSSDYLGSVYKIFLRDVVSREDGDVETEVAVITGDKILYLNARNGAFLREESLREASAVESKFMLVNLKDETQ